MFVFDLFLANTSVYTWLLSVILLCLVDAWTIIHILKNKHDQPASALLWIFLVIELHIFGIILYLLLGINRLNTTGIRVGKAHNTMQSIRSSPGSLSRYLEEVRGFHYIGDTKSEHRYLSILDKILPVTYPICGNELKLLEDGTAAYPKMFNAIQNAKDHIHLQSYIIMNDKFIIINSIN